MHKVKRDNFIWYQDIDDLTNILKSSISESDKYVLNELLSKYQNLIDKYYNWWETVLETNEALKKICYQEEKC